MLAAAALKLQLSELLLQDMITMRKGGVFNWKKHYEQAVTLCGQVMAALAAREAGIPHIQALLHQSLLQVRRCLVLLAATAVYRGRRPHHLRGHRGGSGHLLSVGAAALAVQMEDPKPDHDMRPRYKKIEKVLVAAEEMANKFVAGSCPRDLHPTISMPVARLLARVRLALAELRLMQARARDAHAADDRQKKRPKYPVVATGEQEAEAVVVEVRAARLSCDAARPRSCSRVRSTPCGTCACSRAQFIDAMEPPEVSTSLLPEDTALALAISAAQLCNADGLRAKALLLAGQCLQYKFTLSMPQQLQPWPSRRTQERRRTVIGMGDLTQQLTQGTDGRKGSQPTVAASTAGGRLQQLQAEASGSESVMPSRIQSTRVTANTLAVSVNDYIFEDTGACDGRRSRALLFPASLRRANSDASCAPVVCFAVNPEEDGVDLEAVQQAETYRGQAISTLLEALIMAIAQGQWQDAENCALEIARCHGRRSRAQCTASVQFLCLAQACKAVANQRELILSAQPDQSAEALTLRHAQALSAELPHPEQSIHFQRVRGAWRAAEAHLHLHLT